VFTSYRFASVEDCLVNMLGYLSPSLVDLKGFTEPEMLLESEIAGLIAVPEIRLLLGFEVPEAER
jgi:hypothetical protein